MPRRAARRTGPSIGLILTLIALAMRLVVPAGFMLVPGSGAGTLPSLVICDGAGPAMAPSAMAMPMIEAMAGGHAPKQHDGKSDAAEHGCPFASAAAALDSAPPPVPLLFVPLAVALLPARLLHIRPGLGLAAPPPPSRGPPAI